MLCGARSVCSAGSCGWPWLTSRATRAASGARATITRLRRGASRQVQPQQPVSTIHPPAGAWGRSPNPPSCLGFCLQDGEGEGTRGGMRPCRCLRHGGISAVPLSCQGEGPTLKQGRIETHSSAWGRTGHLPLLGVGDVIGRMDTAPIWPQVATPGSRSSLPQPGLSIDQPHGPVNPAGSQDTGWQTPVAPVLPSWAPGSA